MKLNVRTLKTDGTVVNTIETAADGITPTSAMVAIGTRLRESDHTVAACRCDILPKYTWVGHYDNEQEAAKVAMEIKGVEW